MELVKISESNSKGLENRFFYVLKSHQILQLTKNDNSHAVEDCSDVGHEPQKQCKFEWVNEVLDQEETTQFGDVSIDVSHSNASDLLNLLGWQCQVNIQNFSKHDKIDKKLH